MNTLGGSAGRVGTKGNNVAETSGGAPERRVGRVGMALALIAGTLTLGTAAVVTQPPSPASAAESPGSAVTGGTTFAAYVGAGESLNTDFTKAFDLGAGSNTRFRITDPTGTVRSDCTILGTAADGASTCDQTGLTGAAGVWTIEVIALTGRPANWPQAGSSYFDWDIIVRTAGGAEIEGRVWTEKYRAYDHQRAATPDTFFWVVTDTGSVYEITMNDFLGGGWAFDSDAYGIVQTAGSCTPRYQSMDQAANSPEYAEAGAQCGDPYKVFFETPSETLPETATTPSGVDWVLPEVVTPTIDNVTFTPADATRAGTFTYELANFSGSYSIQIDANADGDYTDPVDRTIPLGGTDGAQTYAWDGRDGAGNAIDPCSAVNARVAITRTDEMHIVLGDTERMTGVTVEQLVGNAVGNTTLYWDDRAIPAANHTTFTPVVDGRAGFDSAVAGGVHGWNSASAGQSWGDHSMIDNWTYSPVDISRSIPLAPICPPPAAAVFGKQVVAGPTPVEGATDTYDVTYQITVRNPGVVDTTYGLSDEFQFGSTVSVVTPPAPAVTAATGTPTPTAGWNGDSATEVVPAGTTIAPGATHTYDVTVRVSFPPITTVNPANDCELAAGESGTGLRNTATLTQPDEPDRTAVACRATGFPNISKSGVVVDGPNTGSTTTAEAGDVIEWKVQYQNVPESEGEGATISDTIGAAQTYVPGSLDAPGGQWTVTSATPPTLSVSHPTNGLPAAVGGTTAFPPPPVQSSSQAGTGGDGFEPIPFGANVYNIFHHQTARLYCTVKQTGALCAGYPASGFVVTPTVATSFPTAATLPNGATVLAVTSQDYIYPDRANGQMWVGGQLITNDGTAAGVHTGRVGYACIDQTTTPPRSCGWVETSAAAAPAIFGGGTTLATSNFFPTMTSSLAMMSQGELLGMEYFGGTTTRLTCLSVASDSLCPSFTVTWPGTMAMGLQAVSDNIFVGQIGTTSRVIITARIASETPYDVCYDTATDAVCAGWPAAPVARTPGAAGTYASKAITTYDTAMNPTGYCHVWTPAPAGAPPTTTCYNLAGAAVPAPAGWSAMWPAYIAAPGWAIGFGTYFQSQAGDTIGSRTYFSISSGATADRVICFDWSTQTACGAPYPFDLNPAVYATPYELNPDDQIPTCMWELGHSGILYSFDVGTGGPCTSTVARLTITPTEYYCASSTPVINGWDRLVVHNVSPAEFSGATLTLRDANGAAVLGWENRPMTGELADGVIDVSDIPYGGTTTTLQVELRFDGIVATAFQAPHPTPSVNLAWVGDPIEMCFRTTVAAVCNVSDIDNTATMAFDPTGVEPNRTSTATASLDYIATSADCFEITKTVLDRTYLGDGNWQITYDIGVTSETAAEGRYHLDDTLRYGAGITVNATDVTNTIPGGVDALPSWRGDTWTGAAPTTRIVTDQTIAGSASHTYRATVQANVPAAVAVTAAADCAADAGENGNTGFSNTATLTGDGAGTPRTATACQSPEMPAVDHTKTLESVTFDAATGEYTLTYLLSASTTGEGLAQYDLTDTLNFPATVDVIDGSQTVTPPAGVTAAAWTGLPGGELVADDAVIDSLDGPQIYTLTLRVRPLQQLGGVPGECSSTDGDLANTSQLTPLAGPPVTGAACAELPQPTVSQTKSLLPASPTFDPATGRWTVRYQITETATGEGLTYYDLDDELMYGANMDIESATVTTATAGVPAPSATWNGETDLRVATAVPIIGGQTHIYEATVEVALTAPQAGTAACSAGEDFSNRATLAVGDYTETDDACGDPSSPTVDLEKESILPVTYDPTTLQYTLTYRVSATATGVGQTFYNATDTLQFGPNVAIDSRTIVADPGSPAPAGTWNGVDSTGIVSNQPINGGQVHSWVVTVVTHLTAPPAGDPAACLAGEDFANQATLTIVNDQTVQTDEVCDPIVTPTVSHDKRLTGVVFDPVSDEWSLSYAIDVTAIGTGTGFYDLADQFQFGPNVTIVPGTTELVVPDGIPDNAAFSGLAPAPGTTIVTGQTIPGGSTQTYIITVDVTVEDPAAPGSCQANEDFYNQSSLTTGGATVIDFACAEPDEPPLTHEKTAESVTFNAATGLYEITYTMTVAASGTGNRDYDLDDTLDFPANVDIVDATVTDFEGLDPGDEPNAAWNGEGITLLAENIGISSTPADGDVHTYTVVVHARLVAPDPVPNDPAPNACGDGSDFVNRSKVTSNANVLEDNACIERPKPLLSMTKTLDGASLDPASGVYTLTYDLAVDASDTPAGQTFYDLTDDLEYGPGITIVATRVVPSPDADTEPTWTGQPGATLLIDDQLITSGESDVVTVEVDVLITAAPNDPTYCNAGVDIHNDALLTASGQDAVADSECVQPPAVEHTKAIIDGPTAIAGQPGHYTVTYRLTETETVGGALPAPYDLTDELRYGPDVTVLGDPAVTTNPDPLIGLVATWDGDNTTTLVDNGVLAPGATHTIDVTVAFASLLPDPPDADATECSGVDGSGLDEDVANTSTLTSNGTEITDDACVPPPHPLVDHSKTLTGITPNGDGTYTVGYSIVATNTGDGAGIYDLGDTLRYGAGVEIVGTPTVAASAGVNLVGGWNGTTSTPLVDDQPIEPAAQQTFTITIVIRPNPTTTVGGATDCTLGGGESGTGVRNESRLTAPGGVDQTRTACGELPHFVIDKTISSGPTEMGNGQYQLGYSVTVTNDGAGAGAYDLADHLTYGANVTILATTVGNTAPGGIATNPGWNGTSDTTVATGVGLAAGGVHTYGVMVTFSVPAGSGGSSNDCTLDPGESGTGLLNTATVNNNGTTNQDSACALVVSPPPPPPTPTVPPTNPDPGELPATGGNSMPITQIALLLVALGGLVVVATRRNLRRRRSA